MPRYVNLRRGKATTIFLIAVGLMLAYLSFQLARPFLTAIAWSTILAVIFAPLHKSVRRHLKSENLSAVVSTILTVLLGVLPVALLVVAISREAAAGYRQMRDQLATGSGITETRGVGPVVRRLNDKLRDWDIDASVLGSQATSYVGEVVVALARGTITNLSSFLVNVLLVAFTLFFFFRDGPRILTGLDRMVPVDLSTDGGIFELIGSVTRAAVFGVVVLGLLKGLLAGLAFWALGLHSPVLWGTAGAVASVIPVFGISLVWIPAAVVLWLQGMTGKALIMLIWGGTVLSLIDNFLYPILVRSRVRLHTLLVFFSTLGGLSVFGFLGFVLGPVVAILTLTLAEVVSQNYVRPQTSAVPSAPEPADADVPS